MKRILIVDDHAPVIRVLARLCAGPPDFLITDIDMPRMSGKELCLAIEEQFPGRTFPIVVLTSRTEMEHRDWTRSIDNLTFMEKPVSVRRLVSHIRNCFAEPDLAAATS